MLGARKDDVGFNHHHSWRMLLYSEHSVFPCHSSSNGTEGSSSNRRRKAGPPEMIILRSIIIISGSSSYKQILGLSCCHPRSWYKPMDSLFLRELPVVSLAEGKTKAFIADFPESRPPFEHIKLWVEEWRAQIDEKG